MLTAPQKIMQKLVHAVSGVRHEEPDAVEAAYSALQGEDEMCDAESEMRGGTAKTEIQPEYSRHYSSRSVAAQMLDGSWVGWTYFYGGGKHGEPSEMPWIENAYDVTMAEETRVVQVFRKVEPAA